MMPHCSQLTFGSKNHRFLDIPAISTICRFGWAECPTSPTRKTIAPELKHRISQFSQGHIAEGIYNLAQHAISELLYQPDGSFQSRTYTSVKPTTVFERDSDELIIVLQGAQSRWPWWRHQTRYLLLRLSLYQQGSSIQSESSYCLRSLGDDYKVRSTQREHASSSSG